MSVEHLGLQSGSFTSLFSIWSKRAFKLTGNLNTNILELNYYWCFWEDQTFPCQQKKRQHAPVKSCIILRDSPPPQAMLYNQWVLTFRYSFQNILALTFANRVEPGVQMKVTAHFYGKKNKKQWQECHFNCSCWILLSAVASQKTFREVFLCWICANMPLHCVKTNVFNQLGTMYEFSCRKN